MRAAQLEGRGAHGKKRRVRGAHAPGSLLIVDAAGAMLLELRRDDEGDA